MLGLAASAPFAHATEVACDPNSPNTTCTGGSFGGITDGSGYFSTVAGTGSSGGGHFAATVYGAYSNVTGDAATAIGMDATAAQGAIAIGSNQTADLTTGNPVGGAPTTATGINAVAIGNAANGLGASSIAFGDTSTATGANSVAIGRGASAANAGLLGPNGETNQGDIAIGSGAIAGAAAGGSTLALGTNARATAPGGAGDSLAIGTSSVASGIDSTAIGGETTASAQNTIAIGNNGTTAAGFNSTVIGVNSGATTSATQSVVLGNNSNAVAANQTVVGVGASGTAAAIGGVALGQGALANRAALAGGAELFSQTIVTSTQGAVSVGTAAAPRQIINVAGGTQPTDAVNVRQLSAVGGGLATALGGGAGFSGTTGAFTPPTYTVGTTNYNNVGAAITALGAGAGSTFVSNNAAAAAAPTATGANASAGGYGASATGAGSTVVGNGATDNGRAGAVAVGNNAAVLGAGSIAIGQGTTANTAISTQDVVDFRTPGNPLKQINNLPAGTTGFVPTGTAIGALSTVGNGGGVAIGYNNNAGNTVQSQVSTAIGANNLSSGVNSITLGLNNTASNRGSIAIGTDSQSTGLRAIAMGREAYAYGDFSVAQGYLASSYGANSLAYGPNSVAGVNGGAAAGDVAIGSGATSTLGNSVALGAGSMASRGAEAGYTGYAVGTQTSAGELAVGTAAAARTITGVSAGRLGTDAVNVSQLNAVGTNLAGSLGGGAAFDPTTGAYTAPVFTTAAGTTAGTVQAALGNETAAITSLGNGTATKLGGGVTYDPTTGLLGNGFTVNGTTYGDVASAISGAAANDGLVQRTATAGQVAVTAPGGTGTNPGAAQVVTNVAAGQVAAGSTQAVNGGQLYGTANSVATALGGGSAVNPDGTVSAPGYTVGGQTYNNVGAALTAGNALAVQYTPDATGAPTNAIDLTKGGTLAPVGVTGLANATTPTGAVALAQLPMQYSTAAAPTTANPAVPSNDVTLVGAAAGTPVALHNLAAGTVAAASTDAVNGGQLYGTANSVATALGGGSTVNPDGTVSAPAYTVGGTNYNTVGGAIGALDNGLSNGQIGAFRSDNTAGVAAPAASGANSVAGGFGASATGAGSTVVGNSATDNGVANATIVGNGASVTAGLAGSNVALGQGTVAGRGAEIGYTGYGVGTQTSAGEVAVGSVAAPRTITGVSAGRLGTDAANVSQLNAVGGNLAGSLGGGAAFDATTGAYTAPVFTTAAGTTANTVQAALGNETAAITSLGNGTATKLGGGVTYNAATGQLGNGFTVNGTTYGDVASAISGAAANDGVVQRTATPGQVAVTALGGTGTAPGAAQVVTNVAAGQVAAGSTQAVNGGQLYGTANSVATALGGGSTVNPDGTVSAPGYTVAGTSYNNVGGAIGALDAGLANGQIGAFRSDNTAGAAAPAASGANSVAGGFGASATGAGSTVVGNSATDNGVANATIVGNGASVTAGLAGSNVALGQGTVAGRGAEAGYTGYGVGTQTSAGEVAVGSAAAPRTITGVSAGRLGTDAVNVSQLSAVGSNLAGSLGGGAAFDATTGAYTAPAYTVGGQTYNNVGAALTAGNALAVQYTPDATGAPTNAVDLTKGGTLAPVAVTGLANATTATGAVTLAQMPLQYSTAAAPTTANPAVPSGDVTLVGATAGTTVGLHNLAAGTLSATSTDAVNGSQLFGVSNNVDALGTTTAAAIGGNAAYTPGVGISGLSYTLNGAAAPFTNLVAGEQALASGAAGPVQYAVPGTPGNAVNLVGTGGAVTLGNVAPGALTAGSTDAVNGGQLYTTNQNVAALTNGTAGLVQQAGAGAPITVGAGTDGTAVGFANNAGAARTLTGVAAGTIAAGSTQAVNGGQLAGTAGSVATALGGGSTVNPDGTISAPTYNVANGTFDNVGSALTALNNGLSNGQLGAFHSDNTAGAAAPVATGANSVAGGFGASATGAGSTVVGNGATDNGVANATVLGNGAAVTAGLAGSNVALGQGTVAGRGAETGYTGFGVGTTTSAGEVAIGTAAAPRTVTGVAAGRLGTDAVNVSQLSAVGGNLAGSLGGGAAFDPTTGAYTAPAYTVGGQTYNNVGAALAAGSALAVQYTPDATGAATNAIDLTKGGTLNPVTMTGLAAGALTATSTDAVNGSQLFATNQQLAAIAGGQAGLVQQDPATRAITVGAGTDGTTVGFANNAGAARTLTGVAAGTVAAGSTEAVNGGQLYGTAGSVAAALGGGATVNPDGTVSAPTYGVNGKSYGSVGGAITALDSTGVKYDTDPTTGGRGQSITLAGGDPNQPVVIHNVGTGTARTDAANLGQVQDAEAAANQYTNQKVAGINSQLSGVNNTLANLESNIAETRQEARSAAAIGLAAASLRYDDRPGKFSVAAGGGYWRGEAAGAFGLGYTLPDGHFRINATAATSGTAVGVGAGASYTFN